MTTMLESKHRADLKVGAIAVKVVTGHVLGITFSTGEVGFVDMGPLLPESTFDSIRDDYAAFQAVRADLLAGSVVWRNGVRIAADELYQRAVSETPAESVARPALDCNPPRVAWALKTPSPVTEPGSRAAAAALWA
jgi:Protein of unknown function (DUF2442)